MNTKDLKSISIDKLSYKENYDYFGYGQWHTKCLVTTEEVTAIELGKATPQYIRTLAVVHIENQPTFYANVEDKFRYIIE